MPDTSLNTGSAIANYIRDVKDQIRSGLGEDASLAGPIDVEMSTTLEKGRGGVFNISVLQAGAKVKELEVHKIRVPIKLNSEADKMEEEARRAEAEFQKSLSERKTEALKKGTHPNQIKR